MKTSTLTRFAVPFATVSLLACQPARPAAVSISEPTIAIAGGAKPDEAVQPASVEHAHGHGSGHTTATDSTPADMGGAREEASGAEAHMGPGGMNMPELGEYDPADWSDQPGAAVGDVTRCPVSGEAFRVTEDSTYFEHNGEKVYFCCPGCIRQFQRNPDALLVAAFPRQGSSE